MEMTSIFECESNEKESFECEKGKKDFELSLESSNDSSNDKDPKSIVLSSSSASRRKFTEEEDKLLTKLVSEMGPRKWDLIAKNMPNNRTARQCRDRYSNYLIPGFFNGEWSKEEDELLYQKYQEYGPKWALIKEFFSNRSPNSIKNRWNYFVSRSASIASSVNAKQKAKEQNPIGQQNYVMTQNVENTQPIFSPPQMVPVSSSPVFLTFWSCQNVIPKQQLEPVRPDAYNVGYPPICNGMNCGHFIQNVPANPVNIPMPSNANFSCQIPANYQMNQNSYANPQFNEQSSFSPSAAPAASASSYPAVASTSASSSPSSSSASASISTSASPSSYPIDVSISTSASPSSYPADVSISTSASPSFSSEAASTSDSSLPSATESEFEDDNYCWELNDNMVEQLFDANLNEEIKALDNSNLEAFDFDYFAFY